MAKDMDTPNRLTEETKPISMPQFEGPFIIYPVESEPYVYIQGMIHLDGGTKIMTFRVPLCDDDAMELLGALEHYRKLRGYPHPEGEVMMLQ